MPVIQLVVYCVLILLSSLAAGWIPIFIRLTHRGMQLAISFVSGVMLGVGLLHLLPHAVHEVGVDNLDEVLLFLLVGFLAMFFVERFFCFHHHDVPGDDNDSNHSHQDCHAGHDPHQLTWSGAAVGLTLHSVLAGVALAASVQSESHDGNTSFLAGFGTFLVIVLHKPFDSLTLGTLLSVSNRSKNARHVINGLFSLAVPIGAVLFYLGAGGPSRAEGYVLGYALAFSAGTFLCISMSDLLPELQFHQHDRVKLSLALILGLVLAWVIGYFEASGHGHEHDHKHRHSQRESTVVRSLERGIL